MACGAMPRIAVERHDLARDGALSRLDGARPRRSSAPAAVGQRQLAGDDARDVRPVAEVVDERRADVPGRRGEIGVGERCIEQQRLVFSKVRMVALHARVEHSPHDLRAARRERRERRVGLDGAHRMREQRLAPRSPARCGRSRAPANSTLHPPTCASSFTSARIARPSSRAKTYWSLKSGLAMIDADAGAVDARVGAGRQRDGDEIGDALPRAISSARVGRG